MYLTECQTSDACYRVHYWHNNSDNVEIIVACLQLSIDDHSHFIVLVDNLQLLIREVNDIPIVEDMLSIYCPIMEPHTA